MAPSKMQSGDGQGPFAVSSAAYDRFMGRYARELAPAFADFAGIRAGQQVLDVGCGPGALTREASRRVGAGRVCAIDPVPAFVEAARGSASGVDARVGHAEALPFADASFDVAVAQLVWHFVKDASRAAGEMARVVRPGGSIAACVWDFQDGMEMLRAFWDAALQVDPQAPDEARVLRFGQPGEIVDLMTQIGLREVSETTITVRTDYAHFDELWSSLLEGVGPAGSYLIARQPAAQEQIHGALHRRIGSPSGPFSLHAVARAGRGFTAAA